MEKNHTTCTLFLLLLLLCAAATTQESSTNEPLLAAAVETLTNSSFLSMALTFHLASPTLRLPSAAVTIFVAPNAAFVRNGELPLSLLEYHIIPTRLTLETLSSLPPKTPLPTLLPNSPLILTLTSPSLSLNDVVVSTTPIFDNGSLLMLAIDDFFNSSTLQIAPPETLPSDAAPFAAVSDVLKSSGCSVMAMFLEAQLSTVFAEGAKLTVFAPLDEAIADGVRNISGYSAIFRKHVVPRLIT